MAAINIEARIVLILQYSCTNFGYTMIYIPHIHVNMIHHILRLRVKLLISLLWKNMATTWVPLQETQRGGVEPWAKTISNAQPDALDEPEKNPVLCQNDAPAGNFWKNARALPMCVFIYKYCFYSVCLKWRVMEICKTEWLLSSWLWKTCCSMHLPDLPGIAMLTLALALVKDLSEQYCVGGKGGDGGSPFGPLITLTNPPSTLATCFFLWQRSQSSHLQNETLALHRHVIYHPQPQPRRSHFPYCLHREGQANWTSFYPNAIQMCQEIWDFIVFLWCI